MVFSHRTVTRAGVVALAILGAACSDSTTAPLNVTPDQLQAMGENIATEIDGGIMQLTPQDVMSTSGGAPSFSRVPRFAGAMLGGASYSRAATGASLAANCGTPSQNPPVDSDGDQVPDNFSVTFTPQNCHYVDQDGSTYDLSGVFRISDPQPGTAGAALNVALDNVKLAFSTPNGTGYAQRDGSASVDASSTGLSQTANWMESAQFTGIPTVSAHVDWAATFAAAQGQSITAGQPLPDGVYQPNGTVSFQQGNRTASFSLTTIDPLQYSASCATAVANGTATSPFSAGRVRVAVSSEQGKGYADVTYSACSTATVVLVSQ